MKTKKVHVYLFFRMQNNYFKNMYVFAPWMASLFTLALPLKIKAEHFGSISLAVIAVAGWKPLHPLIAFPCKTLNRLAVVKEISESLDFNRSFS